ncbi:MULTISPECIES: WXG100 family type VII secretion target [unclassified Nocardia]|uniref:WXG100 family type VII secretion target n=1 Tax=Nocardia sp. NPDC004860 TaxID=3154557 RepID=UPI0033B064A8
MTSSSATPGEGFHVVPADVTDAGRFVQLTAEELIRGVKSLDAEVTSLLTTWKGNSADQYRHGWEEVHAGAHDVLEALKSMAELLGVSATMYTDMDQGNSGDFCSL